jgi:hypothetical protein
LHNSHLSSGSETGATVDSTFDSTNAVVNLADSIGFGFEKKYSKKHIHNDIKCFMRSVEGYNIWLQLQNGDF